MTKPSTLALVLLCAAAAAPAHAQFPGADRVVRGAMLVNDLNISAEDERAIGAAVSQRIRERYGVVQDKAVHRYVGLVGNALSASSAQPSLQWQFIVLDTDGVNAFAAPGGFIHVTRGALALIQNEAELAGVLGHEIIHVTAQHTIKAIKKSKVSELGVEAGAAKAPGGGLSQMAIGKMAEKATDMVLAGFGRAEEMESDAQGIVLATAVGYAPNGLPDFLTRLAERNKAATAKRGLFASHPEMKERIDKLNAGIQAKKLAGTAVLAERYKRFVAFESKPQTEIAVVEAGAAGLTGGGSSGAQPGQPPKAGEKTGEKTGEADKPAEQEAAKKEEEAPKKKKGMFGLGNKMFGGSEEKKSAQVTGSGGARGVDPERDARGGANPALVAVALSASDVASFKKEGNLK
jgi:predicted Zn-dependent protease